MGPEGHGLGPSLCLSTLGPVLGHRPLLSVHHFFWHQGWLVLEGMWAYLVPLAPPRDLSPGLPMAHSCCSLCPCADGVRVGSVQHQLFCHGQNWKTTTPYLQLASPGQHPAWTALPACSCCCGECGPQSSPLRDPHMGRGPDSQRP